MQKTWVFSYCLIQDKKILEASWDVKKKLIFPFLLSIPAILYLLIAGNEQFLIIFSWFCFASLLLLVAVLAFQLHKMVSSTQHW